LSVVILLADGARPDTLDAALANGTLPNLARMRDEPHPSAVRRGPLLYNIWDARSEGMATAMEELMLHAGLFDDEPRAREIVWIMLAQRAARGLASLYLQANEFDLAQAKAFQVEWTPRGWMRPDLDLLGIEQQLYLRQPGYGTSYITGKVQLEDLMRERAHQLGDAFTTRRWFEEVYSAGIIPVSLIRWQLTGKDEEIRAIAATQYSTGRPSGGLSRRRPSRLPSARPFRR